MRRGILVALSAALIASVALAAGSASADPQSPPLGIPVPSSPTLEELISTQGESGDASGILPGVGACDSAPHRPIRLPADDAAHNKDTYIEFWWWYGHLTTQDGREFAYMLWFASKPAQRIQWTDFTLTDLTDGTFHYGRQPLIRGLPKATSDGFDLRGRNASAAGGDGRDRLRLRVDGYELDLSLQSTKPAVIQLGDGYFTAYCNSSYFYTRPRMRTTGTLRHAGNIQRVKGTSDFLRQWGFNAALEVANTTGLMFQLDDGRDIFAGVVRLRMYGDEVTLYLGSISDARGHVTTLHRGDFTLTPTRYWQRDASCRYPVAWDVDIKGLHLHTRPSLDQAEVRATRWPQMYALWPAWPVYWDGQMRVTGDATGLGWMDLNRYCAI